MRSPSVLGEAVVAPWRMRISVTTPAVGVLIDSVDPVGGAVLIPIDAGFADPAMVAGVASIGVPATVLASAGEACAASESRSAAPAWVSNAVLSVAFVAAIFVSNIPQGAAGSISMQQAGVNERRIFAMWTGLTAACAIASGLGFILSDTIPEGGLYAQAFAAGAVLTMLADSMMPEAFEHGGRTVGLIPVFGFLTAGVLSVAG